MLGEERDVSTDPAIDRLRRESCPLTASKTQDAISVCNGLSYEPDPLTVPARNRKQSFEGFSPVRHLGADSL